MSEAVYITVLKNPFFIFFYTLTFALLPRYTMKFKISSYIKCFTGGVILSIIILHVFPDLYEIKNLEAPLAAGVSFLILFAIDKLYIDGPDSNHQGDSLPDKSTKLQALIFVLALSVHSFFEGVSIPVKTGTELFWNLVSLLGHKWIEAFSLGLSIEISGFKDTIKILLVLIYSVLTPFGSIMGVLISRMFAKTDKITEAGFTKNLLIGISSGSFFYIGFIEMLNSEFKHNDNINLRIRKLFSVVIGFAIMSAFLSCMFHTDFMQY
ncbi:Zinc transporter ZIP1 [Cucumispora dikerogammari]|nr:Zinc transporter ZIP1 [Cucumispora dikerogammari]